MKEREDSSSGSMYSLIFCIEDFQRCCVERDRKYALGHEDESAELL